MISILTTQFDFEIVNLHHKKLLIDNMSYIHYAISLLGLSFFSGYQQSYLFHRKYEPN